MLAMTYMYKGQREIGLDLAYRNVRETMRRGWYWDWSVILDSAAAERAGRDYYQKMMLWSLPAALQNQDLMGPCQPGGLVERVLRAEQRG